MEPVVSGGVPERCESPSLLSPLKTAANGLGEVPPAAWYCRSAACSPACSLAGSSVSRGARPGWAARTIDTLSVSSPRGAAQVSPCATPPTLFHRLPEYQVRTAA